ncbi:hypothetical protein E2P65_02775 [Candidatus Bathyarchaeota archaeon]|nr:hypothetical protein E2P65_02775 [Candidatus Bathyarchaeota archaeon]
MERDGVIWGALAVSLAGVILIGAYMARPGEGVTQGGSSSIWALFVSICLLGAVATLLPHRCSPSRALPRDLDPSKFTIVFGVRLHHGHHITCSRFQGHEHNIQGRSFCASCTGMLAGSLAAIAVATLYFLYGWNPGRAFGYTGLACVVLGLLYIPLRIARGPIQRSLINALFVLGFSLILSTVDASGSAAFDLVVIGISVFWMFTRIQLSSWSYDRICDECGEECWTGEPKSSTQP